MAKAHTLTDSFNDNSLSGSAGAEARKSIMRLIREWLRVVILCCAGAASGGEHPDARLREAQAAFEKAKELLDAGRYADGVPYGEQALALREAVLGGSHPEVANCLNLVGELYGRQVDLARAEPLFQRGLSIREAALGKDHPDVASSLTMLGELYWVQGSYSRAEPLFERALAIREAALGKDHPEVAISLYDLASLYKARGPYNRAEPLFQRALAIREATLGSNHPLTAELLNDLAELYLRQGLYSTTGSPAGWRQSASGMAPASQRGSVLCITSRGHHTEPRAGVSERPPDGCWESLP